VHRCVFAKRSWLRSRTTGGGGAGARPPLGFRLWTGAYRSVSTTRLLTADDHSSSTSSSKSENSVALQSRSFLGYADACSTLTRTTWSPVSQT
jgi:hypothetical protein